MKTWLITWLTCALLAPAALALTPPPQTPPPERSVDFPIDEVTVERLEPEPVMMEWLRQRQRESLIRYRVHFKAELVRSAHDI